MSDEIQIVNVVGTGDLVGTVNLEHLYEAATASVVQYDPVHHQGCYVRFEENGPLITVYNSGKYIIRANSVDEVFRQRDLLLEHLREIGVPDTVVEESFDINNIVASADLNRELDLKALSEDLGRGKTTFSPSSGRIDYRLNSVDCTITIFRTGKVVLMGASTLDDINIAWKEFKDEIEYLFQEVQSK